MKLHDKAFYKSKTANDQSRIKPNILTADQLFDRIMHIAQMQQMQQGPIPPGQSPTEPPVDDKMQYYKEIGLNDQQIEQVMKVSVDQPDGTAANPIDGQRDSLSFTELDGTGKIAGPDDAESDDARSEQEIQAPKMVDPLQETDIQNSISESDKIDQILKSIKDSVANRPINEEDIAKLPPEQQNAARDAIRNKYMQEAINALPADQKALVNKLQKTEKENLSSIFMKMPLDKQKAELSRIMKMIQDLNAQRASLAEEIKTGRPAQGNLWESVMTVQEEMAYKRDIANGIKNPKRPEYTWRSPMGTKQLPKVLFSELDPDKQAQYEDLVSKGGITKTKDTSNRLKLMQRQQDISGKISYLSSIYQKFLSLMSANAEDDSNKMEDLSNELTQMDERSERFKNPERRQDYNESGEKVTPESVGTDVPVNRVDSPGYKPVTKRKERNTKKSMHTTAQAIPMPPAAGAPAKPPMGGSPAKPPAGGAPMPPPDGMPPDKKKHDDRSLSELAEDIKDDVDSLTEKIEGGEAIGPNGKDIAPVTTDTGAMPAPAPKVSVDQSAKDYFHSYYGPYGDDLTSDSVDELVSVVERAASEFGVKLSADEATRLFNLVSHAAGVSAEWRKISALGVAMQVVASGAYKNAYSPSRSLYASYINIMNANMPDDLTAKFATLRKLAEGKMKQPSINKKHEDAVKLDKMKDMADDEDSNQLRPAHLMFKVDDKEHSGAYLKMSLSWDPDDKAANRTDSGMRNAIRSFIKGLESKKEFLDYGYMGKVVIEEFDPEAGMASVSVRTQKPGDAPLSTRSAQVDHKLTRDSAEDIGYLEVDELDMGNSRSPYILMSKDSEEGEVYVAFDSSGACVSGPNPDSESVVEDIKLDAESDSDDSALTPSHSLPELAHGDMEDFLL